MEIDRLILEEPSLALPVLFQLPWLSVRSSNHPSTVRTFQEGRRVRTVLHHTSGHFVVIQHVFLFQDSFIVVLFSLDEI